MRSSLRAFIAARSRYGRRRARRRRRRRRAAVHRARRRAGHLRLSKPACPTCGYSKWTIRRRRLETRAAAGGRNIPLPASLVFAGVNFETETLSERLREAGFDAGRPGILSWLGVVPYLGAQAVIATLRWIAGLPRRRARSCSTTPSRRRSLGMRRARRVQRGGRSGGRGRRAVADVLRAVAARRKT